MKTLQFIYCMLFLIVQVNYTSAQNCTTSPTQPGTTGECGFIYPHTNKNTHSMIRDKFDDLITVGVVVDPNVGTHKFIQLTKTNPSCGIVWSITYDGPAQIGAVANDLTTDYDGNIYFTGYVKNANGTEDIVIAKFDVNGHYVWETFYGSNNLNNRGNAIIHHDGNVYVVGIANQANWQSAGITLAYTENGKYLWESLESDRTENLAVCVDTRDWLWVAGISHYVPSPMYIMHMDPANGAGYVMYNSLSPNSIYDENIPNTIFPFSDGVIVGATSFNDVNNSNDYYFVRYDFGNSVVWSNTFDLNNNYENLEDIYIDRSNGIVYATGGTQYISDETTRDILTVSLSALNGNLNWSTTTDGFGQNEDSGLEIELDCIYQPFVGAYATQLNSPYFEFYILRYETSAGAVNWSATNNNNSTTNSSTLHDIALTSQDVFASGTYVGTPEIMITGFDAPYKDCKAARLSNSGSDKLQSDKNIYPNPSSGKFTFYSETPGLVSIRDIQNRLVKNIEVKSGNNDIDLQNIQNGIYILRMIDDGGVSIQSETIVINK